jgi:hypothetical protein
MLDGVRDRGAVNAAQRLELFGGQSQHGSSLLLCLNSSIRRPQKPKAIVKTKPM